MKRRVLVLGLATMALLAATVSAAVMPGIPTLRPAPAVWTPLAVSTFALPAGANIEAQTSFAITSDTQYFAFQRTAGGSDYPYVDFTKSLVVVASLGIQDLGNKLTITKAASDGSHIAVYLNQQSDNPNHCRNTHNFHQVGQLAVIAKPSNLDASKPGVVGFQKTTSVMPYSAYYQCGCPEMGQKPADE